MKKIDAVFIEAGHGLSWGGFWEDNGAVWGEITEYDINCSVARRVVAILNKKPELKNALVQGIGYNARATKRNKINWTNWNIKQNGFNPDRTLFISLHCNSNTGVPASGVECWLGENTRKCETLSEQIRKALVKYFDFKDRGNKERPLYHQEINGIPTLVEMGFINNSYDISCLTNYDRMAQAIAHGILNYIRSK